MLLSAWLGLITATYSRAAGTRSTHGVASGDGPAVEPARCFRSREEEHFVERLASALEALSVAARKLLCGRSHRIVSAQRVHTACSVLIVEFGAGESLAVQCCGIEPSGLLGCGLFVPYKTIGPVRRLPEDG